MALNTLRALLTAQARSRWNGMRRESGAAGPLATLAVLALLAVVLSLPCVGMLWVGLHLGRDLATAAPSSKILAETLRTWNQWMFLYTVIFALLGNFRHEPAFSFAELARLPITAMQLLLAEIPATLLEVFPILGAVGIVSSHLGLAIRMPTLAPLIALLAATSLLAMLAMLLLLAALRRGLAQSRFLLVALVIAFLGGAWWLDLETLRWMLRGGAAGIPWLPVSQAYAGLVDLRLGEPISGVTRVTLAVTSTLGLLVLAAWVHQRERSREQAGESSRRGRTSSLRFTHPAVGVGRLFLKQLLDSKMGRATLFVPFILVLPVAIVLAMVQALLEQSDLLIDQLTRVQKITELPLLGLLLFLLVIVNSQIWMNQFGWDRGGIRTLLVLPISTRNLLLGKLIGMARFTGLQALLGAMPLLWVYKPSASEVLTGLAASGFGLLTTACAGHLLSARFPRGVDREGTATLPLYLAWVPSLVVVLVVSILAIVGLVARSFGDWATSMTFLTLFILGLGGYFHYLPSISQKVHQHRERLLQM